LNRIVIFYAVFLILLLTANAISFFGCDSGGSPMAPGTPVSFSGDVLPIFEKSCNVPGCHNSTDKQAGIDLTTWQSIMINGSNFGAEIIPYNSKWSHLMQHINRVDTNISPFSEPMMPKELRPYTNGQPLSRDKIELIMNWINQGAKNDYGEVAFSDITQKAFITNQASDLVAVVNLDNNHLVRLIDVGSRDNTTQQLDAPHVIIVDDPGRYFYVSLIQEGFMEKYDARTYQKLGRIFIGTSPAHIVITADGSKGYITDFTTQGSIKVFNTGSMTITESISDIRMKRPHGLRLTHNGSLLLTATQTSELLYVINISDNQIVDVVGVDPTVPPAGTGTGNFIPYQIAITPDDMYAFVSCRISNDVRVFDIQARAFVQNIPVGLNPLALEISPDGRWCYVPNQASNSVTVIDIPTRTVVKTITNIGAQPHKIDFTADGHYAYVTCESLNGTFVHHPPVGSSKPGTTCAVDVWGGHIKVKDIEMASFPAGISITPGKGN
jgi:YVTN family beta-propeller protein